MAALWLVLLLMAAVRPLAVPDEGRYGEIGRWMLQSGDWLTPRLNGIPFFHKPPLLYWLEAMSLAVFGVHELALRLVPVLHVGLMMVALYLAARAISTERVARRSAVMLGTSLSFLIGGQYINHDMMVATWIGVAIWCFAFAFMAGDKPNAALARLGFVAYALGMLSKGLIGIALPGLVLVIWLLWTRQFKKMLYLPWLSGLALFTAIALPWFVLAQQKYPQFFDYMFVGQQFNRYTASTYNNAQPVWFYLLALVLLLFPWAFFAMIQLRRTSSSASVEVALVGKNWWRLCWVWVAAIVGFFSIPNSKIIGYVLPVMPAIALLAALGWERVFANRVWSDKLFAGLGLFNIGLAVVLVTQLGQRTHVNLSQDAAIALACAAKPSDTVYALGDFPYDLPFYAQTSRPLVVLENWSALRETAGDNWRRELFEGVDFDKKAGQVLQSPEVLAQAGSVPGNWLVARKDDQTAKGLMGWVPFYQGAGWRLYRSAGGSAAESPVTAEQKGLPGCKDHRNK